MLWITENTRHLQILHDTTSMNMKSQPVFPISPRRLIKKSGCLKADNLHRLPVKANQGAMHMAHADAYFVPTDPQSLLMGYFSALASCHYAFTSNTVHIIT